jgi:toxin ParE1/3/4
LAHRVIWSETALEDVDAIAAYIARDSAHYAAAVVRRILTSTRQLGEHPWSGRVVPELEDPSIREILVYSYRVVYRVQDQVVTVSAVVHARRSFESGIGRTDRSV